MKIRLFGVEFTLNLSFSAVRKTVTQEIDVDTSNTLIALATREQRSVPDMVKRATALYEWVQSSVVEPGLRLCAVTHRGVIKSELGMQPSQAITEAVKGAQ